MKKILYIILIFLITIFIIIYSKTNTKNITLIGNSILSQKNNYINELYKNFNKKNINFNINNDFINKYYRITDLLNIIKENKQKNNKTIQFILKKSNIIVLSIGEEELNYIIAKEHNKYEYIDIFINDLEKLFILIRKYTNADIYYLGLNKKSNNDIINYINERIKKIVKENRINYIKNDTSN